LHNQLLTLSLIIGFFSIISLSSNRSVAQVNVSATPVQVVIPTSTIPATQLSIATATPTATPTEEGPLTLSLRPESETANVRAEPEPTAEILGTIEPGESYRVLGRYFSWLQLEFDASPNGRAWVFEELVEINGDPNEVQVVDPFADPTDVPEVLEATLTWEAITLTPGGILTATAQSRIIEVPTSIGDAPSADINAGDILPTFTYPPDLVAQVPTEIGNQAALVPTESDALTDAIEIATSTRIPPIAFILGLGGIGVLGLVIASLRS